jgi:hypothetical protein
MFIAFVVRHCITRAENPKPPDGSDPPEVALSDSTPTLQPPTTTSTSTTATGTASPSNPFVPSSISPSPATKIESSEQLNVAVNNVFPANMDTNASFYDEKMWLGKIFLATYPRYRNFSFPVDGKFLLSVYDLVNQDRLAEALMLTVPTFDRQYPIIYPALCWGSSCQDNPDISCSKYAYDLLLKLKPEERKNFFEKHIYNNDNHVDASLNTKNGIISAFTPPPSMEELANCTNCIDFLMKIPKDECEELLKPKDWNQWTIVDHMKEMQAMAFENQLHQSIIEPCNKIIEAYKKLVQTRELDIHYSL